jgi:Fe-Mn family superoxide dismutase
MSFTLPPLPYKEDALEPHISARTLSFHYGKHHQAYVTNLNTLIQGTDLENSSLEEIIRKTASKPDKVGIFNNGAQVWNHTFYWHSLSPSGGGEPGGSLGDKIKQDFGSFDEFAKLFKQAGVGQFGSGWAWLVLDKEGCLKVTKTSNADLPMIHDQRALLTCDVWEHAYYLDYQNRRPDYMDIFLKNLVNWDFAQKNFEGKGLD